MSTIGFFLIAIGCVGIVGGLAYRIGWGKGQYDAIIDHAGEKPKARAQGWNDGHAAGLQEGYAKGLEAGLQQSYPCRDAKGRFVKGNPNHQPKGQDNA